jgi:hypothetical protein
VEREWRIVIPRTDNSGRPIRYDVLEGYVQEASQHFGGATVHPRTQGRWILSELYGGKTLHCEPTMIVDLVRTGADRTEIAADGQWVEQFASRIGRQLGQEAVFEQQELATRTEFRPGRALERLPDDLIQQGPPPTTPLGRALAGS